MDQTTAMFKRGVRILNPVAGGAEYTTPTRAVGFIKRGLAEVAGENSIRFVSTEKQTFNQQIATATVAWAKSSGASKACNWRGTRKPWAVTPGTGVFVPGQVRS